MHISITELQTVSLAVLETWYFFHWTTEKVSLIFHRRQTKWESGSTKPTATLSTQLSLLHCKGFPIVFAIATEQHKHAKAWERLQPPSPCQRCVHDTKIIKMLKTGFGSLGQWLLSWQQMEVVLILFIHPLLSEGESFNQSLAGKPLTAGLWWGMSLLHSPA